MNWQNLWNSIRRVGGVAFHATAGFIFWFLIVICLIALLGTPLAALSYWCGGYTLGHTILLIQAMICVTGLFVFWVSDVIALKVLRIIIDVGLLPLNFLDKIVTPDIKIEGISKEFIHDFKKSVTDSLGWFMFYLIFIAVFGFETYPLGLFLIHIAFLFLATVQEGWFTKPPKFARFIAYSFVILMLCGVVLRIIFPKTYAILSSGREAADDVMSNSFGKSAEWISKELGTGVVKNTNLRLSNDSNLAVADTENADESDTSFVQTDTELTLYGQSARKHMIEIMRKESEGLDFESEIIQIRRVCEHIIRTDISDKIVSDAFRRFCRN